MDSRSFESWSDFDKIKEHIINCLARKLRFHDSNNDKDILRYALIIMIIAQKIDSYRQADLKLNDIVFLNSNWLENKEFVDSYPSFIYWIIKNNHFISKIQQINSESNFSENSIPFWLFAVRIMSSLSCIKFECSSNNKSAKFIQEIIERTIIDIINTKIRNSEHIGTKWLNLLLSSVPSEIYDENCQIFRQYFLNLSKDTKDLTDYINDVKKDTIKIFIQKICHMILDDKLDLLLDTNMLSINNTENFEPSFIMNPNAFILSKVATSKKLKSNEFNDIESLQVFDKHFQLPIPIDSPFNDSEKIFTDIKKYNIFSNPVLSEKNGEIVCSYSYFDCQIDPIIPSLYSDKISLNFISLINKKFTVEIETEDKKYASLFSTKGNYSENDSVEIFISLLSDNQLDKEDISSIPASILIKSKELKEYKLHCNFRFILLPNWFFISCHQYKLLFENNSFHLCTDKIESESKLIFSIKNFYLKDETSYEYQILKLDDNTISNLTINKNSTENTLEIILPKVMNVERLHGEIKLNFSKKFYASIIINAAITPFDYVFDVYDPNEKVYGSKAKIYYSQETIKWDINLHFRIFLPDFINCLEGELEESLPPEAQIISITNINKNFTIKESTEFDVAIRINSQIMNQKNSSYSDEQYFLSIYTNGIKKYIYLSFEKAPTNFDNWLGVDIDYITKFNIYGYQSSDKIWKQIELNSSISCYNCIISPFSILKIDKDEIKTELFEEVVLTKMKEIYNEYFEVCVNESFYKYSTDPFKQIRKNEFKLKSIVKMINLSSLKEEQNEAYLYNENSNPIPMNYIDESKCRSKADYKIAPNPSVWNKNFQISVPKINQELNFKCNTIRQLNKYYHFCIKVIHIFPSFVNSIINDKLEGRNSDIENEVNNCFYKLLHIYKNLSDKDNSLISSTTNLYIVSFVSMIANFNKNGISFGNSLPTNCITSDKLKQDILHYPEKDILHYPLNEFDNDIYKFKLVELDCSIKENYNFMNFKEEEDLNDRNYEIYKFCT